MRKEPKGWQHGVVLVCNNQRPAGSEKPSCGRRQGQHIKDTLKHALRQGGGPASACRVITTSCLGLCPADGVAVAMSPGEDIHVVDAGNEADIELLIDEARSHMTACAGNSKGLLGRIANRARR